ncbi:hypothetical protein [Zwartia panacis]|uniref:hypothetical protein n=1 Tax=Zwartia panacis TaxID=2683345 RepID=UPI0025B4C2DC|nr:hypothetical protein [Zwartia panacis]MDN4017901.1 hypothetical protein [Zwartia panacis]
MKRFLIALFLLSVAHSAIGAPSRIVVLRHGEKENAYALCDVGQQRSLALKAQYLGKGAEKSLFPHAAPTAFFAITLHTLELVAPSADSWGLPVMTYSVVPLPGMSDAASTDWLNRQTQRAATEVMNDSRWRGQTVVMAWEHKHIANQKLEKNNPDALVELRELLKLDQLPEADKKRVPKTWSGSNYNFFWIIDYNDSGQPVAFKEIRQDFTGQFSSVPNNAWDAPEGLSKNSRCKQ